MLRAAVAEAVRKNDIARVSALVDHMRYNLGFRYTDVAAFFERHAGLDADGFEDLMQEADTHDGAADA